MSKFLLAFDTDRIKSYVFATGKLKEIRGASAILDELNREQMVQEVVKRGGEKIYANGGSGLFMVDSNKAETAKAAVEKLYRDETGTASITGVCVNQSADFQIDFKTLGYRLRAAKDSKMNQTALVTHPFLRFCDSCGVDYAEREYTESGETALLCASCIQKREKDAAIKEDIHRIVKQAINKGSVQGAGLWRQLIPALYKQGYPVEGYDRPDDFESLAQMSAHGNYIGLIYADGDSMGKELEKLESETNFKRFSEAVDSSVYQAVAQAISKHLQPQKKIWPFDILLLGGDDLVMVTPADKALEVALTAMEQFTELTRQKLGKPLNLSVGVAIAHANYPFGQLLLLAESTLKFAKKEGAKRRQAGKNWKGGLLNFVVVSSANHLEFNEFYNEDLTARAEASYAQKNLFRTLRPYNAAEFRKLLNFIQNSPLSRAPRSKLQRLREIVFQTKTQAMIDGLTMLFHWRSKKQREAVQDAVFDFTPRDKKGNPEHGMLFPWYQTGPKSNPEFYTPLLDLVEIFNFASAPQPEEAHE